MSGNDASYDLFSRQPEYLAVNREFIDSIVPLVPDVKCVVDLACGTGVMTQLLHAAMKSRRPGLWGSGENGSGRDVTVYAVDLSRQNLQAAQRNLLLLKSESDAAGKYHFNPVFSCSPGDRLPIRDRVADVVVIGNALHLMPSKEDVLCEVRRVLKAGGIFAFNTCFYEGSTIPGTEKFYADWIRGALGLLKSRNETLRPVAPRAEATQRAFSSPWLTQQEYRELLLKHGFALCSVKEKRQALSRECLLAIAAYAEFADAWLHRYLPEKATKALQEALDPALLSFGSSKVARSWMEMVAVNRGVIAYDAKIRKVRGACI